MSSCRSSPCRFFCSSLSSPDCGQILGSAVRLAALSCLGLVLAEVSLGQLYDGKVYGIFDPLVASETPSAITVSGGTFRFVIDRATGQIISLRALADEFVASGSAFPNPYVGLMPPDDPAAQREGGKERPRFGYEKSVEVHPLLWSGGLTDAYRLDAAAGTEIRTEIVQASPDLIEVRSTGRYAESPLNWMIDYLFDVDGFTKVTVSLTTSKPVQLRWHCFNHAFLAKEPIQYLTKVSDPDKPPAEVRPEPTVSIARLAPDKAVFESHWNAFFHLSNHVTGIEFSKQDFGDRHSGYRDSSVRLENGEVVDTGAVITKDHRSLKGWDSRGRANIFTQLYSRDRKLELEEFDIRNTTFPLNPGELRQRVFWVQPTPAKHPRNDLNSLRVVWPGPHQIVMTRWRGRQQPWEPPSDEQVRLWALTGVNLIVGGADYWSGDYARPLLPEKTRRFIAAAHRYDIKVIPYVTFADFNFAAPGYQEHAADWMASQSIEFANETTLMCYNAAGWREYLEKQWDQLLSNFDFDGLYIDHWTNIRLCSNSRHGCDGYLGSFATEGYHDFAKRARRVVARHTDGKGIMLLNANMLLFSGVVPWFDIRLNGENDDPLKMRMETILATWDGWVQGVQSMGEWGHTASRGSMINLLTTFSMANWAISPHDLAQWKAAQSSELAETRELWGIWRSFKLNGAQRIPGFDSQGLLRMEQPGSVVNAFVRDGRALVIMGVHGARGGRKEALHIQVSAKLGLGEGLRYQIIDLRNSRYLRSRPSALAELRTIPVQLAADQPLILLIRPQEKGPNLVWFRGADDVTVSSKTRVLECHVKSVPGSPVELYLDPQGSELAAATPGFKRVTAGDFVVFAGTEPDDGVVRLTVSGPKAAR